MMKVPDDQIVLQMGRADMEAAVATHFPCCCVAENQLIIVSSQKNVVQVAQGKDYQVHPREKYSVFYIDTKVDIKKQRFRKNLFQNNIFKNFKYVVVYGENGMTVEAALRRDGRFIEELNGFTLSDSANPNCKTEHTQKVEKLNKKRYRLCVRYGNKTSTQAAPATSTPSHVTTPPCEDPHSQPSPSYVLRSGAQLSQASLDPQVAKRQTLNTAEIVQLLREQVPALRRLMESRVPVARKELTKLKKEEFGKIQASFSEVHRVKKLMKLSESVCLLQLSNPSTDLGCNGTGFVLFDNIVLTNGHLFTLCKFQVETYEELPEGKVTALFNYEHPTAKDEWKQFNVKRVLDFSLDKLDYAVLELDMGAEAQNKPPGLLKAFSSPPPKGEACIIGHPAGGVKKMDPTCIIGKAYYPFFCHNIINELESGQKVPYMTFMFEGSSGSPVFDGSGQVFGLHTGGYNHEKKRYIEYGQPVLLLFENFVKSLKEKRKVELLERVQEEARGNTDLEKLCGPKVEPHEGSDEEMELD